MAKAKKASKETKTGIELIGDTAGAVWKVLDKDGRMSLTQLGKKVKAPKDAVMQAIGWLAREDKICLEDTGRGRMISLK